MKYLADTHMHSIYSYDGQMSIEEMVMKGNELGLKFMAFTEHLELGQISIKQFLNRYAVYSREIDRLQQKYPNIKLLRAIEFTNPEKYPKELEIVNGIDLDYIIGSNHELPSKQDKKEILEYYKKILEIVKNDGIDSLGHMDYLRRKYDDTYIEEDILREIYSYMIKNGITLEINSSARRRKGLDSFPSNDKVLLYEKCGGRRITLGSDAHRIGEIYDSIPSIDAKYELEKGVYVKRKFLEIK